jgi:O-antigen ligase
MVSAAFVPTFSGAATSPRWAMLAVLLPFMLLEGRGRFTAAHGWGLAFIAWSVVTLAWSSNALDGLDALFKLVLMAQAFVLGSRTESLNPLIHGMAWGLGISSVLVIIQWLGWQDIVITRATPNSGLFVNSGSLGEIAALVLVGTIAFRWWWLSLLVLPSVIIPGSRGAWVGLAAAAIVWLWHRSKPAALTVLGFAIAGTIALALWSFRLSAVTERLGIWSDTISGLTLFGHGLGSFYTSYPYYAQSMDIFVARPEHAHNDFLEVAFETGPLGLALVGLFLLTLPPPLNPG